MGLWKDERTEVLTVAK